MTTERHITAQWVASFLTSPRADGVWLPHHPSNWKAVGAPDHDLLHGWTSPVTPTAGAWAGQVVVKFCPHVIASAAQQLPFSPKEQHRRGAEGRRPVSVELPEARSTGGWWRGVWWLVLVLLVAMVATGPDDGRNER